MSIEIGVPCNPSEIIDSKVEEYYAIKMSCGGGMGGSVWWEYTPKLPITINPNSIFRIKNYKGEELLINSGYVVMISKVKLVTIKTDITEFVNCITKKCNSSIETDYYVVRDLDEEIKIINKYMSECKGCSRIESKIEQK